MQCIPSYSHVITSTWMRLASSDEVWISLYSARGRFHPFQQAILCATPIVYYLLRQDESLLSFFICIIFPDNLKDTSRLICLSNNCKCELFYACFLYTLNLHLAFWSAVIREYFHLVLITISENWTIRLWVSFLTASGFSLLFNDWKVTYIWWTTHFQLSSSDFNFITSF